MLKKRIIPALLLQNSRMVKGKRFGSYRDTGDPVMHQKFTIQYVDELIIVDIEATKMGRSTNSSIISNISEVCFMPLTIGGGINSIKTINELLNSGADKVLINTAIHNNKNFLRQAAKKFGSSCIVVGIDVRLEQGKYRIYKNLGKTICKISLKEYLNEIENEGAGEIYINNISNDGMMRGYDLLLINEVLSNSKIPVIACGGAGNFADIAEAFIKTNIGALAMSSIFHFGDNNPIRLRSYLKNNKILIKNI